ncbi:MAG TPA: PTS sugar transporter subunit IIA [Nannocystaceae bacterium]|nr:PTS sugar transporter subunit IIA [Nannocystaceae bacterium]
MNLPLSPDAIIADLTGTDATSLFAELCAPLAATVGVAASALAAALAEREALAPTALGGGVAMPHGVHPQLSRIVASFGRSIRGVDFGAPDGKPVHLFVALIRPSEDNGLHLKALARYSGVLSSATARDALLAAPDSAAILRIVHERSSGR